MIVLLIRCNRYILLVSNRFVISIFLLFAQINCAIRVLLYFNKPANFHTACARTDADILLFEQLLAEGTEGSF